MKMRTGGVENGLAWMPCPRPWPPRPAVCCCPPGAAGAGAAACCATSVVPTSAVAAASTAMRVISTVLFNQQSEIINQQFTLLLVRLAEPIPAVRDRERSVRLRRQLDPVRRRVCHSGSAAASASVTDRPSPDPLGPLRRLTALATGGSSGRRRDDCRCGRRRRSADRGRRPHLQS